MWVSSFVMSLKIKKWVRNGLVLGNNVEIEKGCSLDPSFPWLISIGNNVTLAPEVCVLAHDASMKYSNAKAKLGRVKIGNNVFIGTKTIILPGVTIGDNVIVGAGSVVTSNVPNDTVVCGSPARILTTICEFRDKNHNYIDNGINFERTSILSGDTGYRRQILELLNIHKFGYIDVSSKVENRKSKVPLF